MIERGKRLSFFCECRTNERMADVDQAKSDPDNLGLKAGVRGVERDGRYNLPGGWQ